MTDVVEEVRKAIRSFRPTVGRTRNYVELRVTPEGYTKKQYAFLHVTCYSSGNGFQKHVIVAGFRDGERSFSDKWHCAWSETIMGQISWQDRESRQTLRVHEILTQALTEALDQLKLTEISVITDYVLVRMLDADLAEFDRMLAQAVKLKDKRLQVVYAIAKKHGYTNESLQKLRKSLRAGKELVA